MCFRRRAPPITPPNLTPNRPLPPNPHIPYKSRVSFLIPVIFCSITANSCGAIPTLGVPVGTRGALASTKSAGQALLRSVSFFVPSSWGIGCATLAHPLPLPGGALARDKKPKPLQMQRFRLLVPCGERGIRTPDTLLRYTHFPGALLKPLGHLSLSQIYSPFQHLAPPEGNTRCLWAHKGKNIFYFNNFLPANFSAN